MWAFTQDISAPVYCSNILADTKTQSSEQGYPNSPDDNGPFSVSPRVELLHLTLMKCIRRRTTSTKRSEYSFSCDGCMFHYT